MYAEVDPQEVEVQKASGPRLLVVDDEERFRNSLANRLRLRGYDVREEGEGERALRTVRQFRPEVVLLDLRMPGMDGSQVLREIKRIAPEVQVVILTGHATLESAAVSGRHQAFAYLEKPCETETLEQTIEAARQEKVHAMVRLDIPQVQRHSIRAWLWGTHNYRPGVMILGALLFAGLFLMPVPEGLLRLLRFEKTGQLSDPIAGYSNYRKMRVGETIAAHYSRTAKLAKKEKQADGRVMERLPAPGAIARKAQVMIGILLVAALFWATGALPIGITALLVAVLMYLFGVFPPNVIAKAYAKDAVIFILGVLALAVAVSKTGLDRRIGLLLLGTSRSLKIFLFVICPLLAVTAAFLSEHALIAFLAPILMVVYLTAVRAAGIKKDRSLAVMLVLATCFVANQGGPGSPAAGGRNAIMVGILSDYGVAPSFGQWVSYGLPFVPVMALVIALYFFLRFRRKLTVSQLDVAQILREESRKLGPMTRQEIMMAVVVLGVIVLWCTASEILGMGGPVILGLVVMAILGLIGWREIGRIQWDVVALYASACAIGVGLADTGAALWLATTLVDTLPEYFTTGPGLAIASSLFTGVLTNIMSDGATVSAIGPITVPMAAISGTHPWMVGLATAFAASFANCLIIGTPNNAIAYSLARDPETGEHLVTLWDFAKHGLVVTGLAFLVLWGWVILGYWQWLGFPS